MATHKNSALGLLVINSLFLMSSPAASQPTPETPNSSVSLSVPIIAAQPTPPAPSPQTQTTGKSDVAVPSIILDKSRADLLAKDLADLASMLGGRWDNELQTFFEPVIDVASASRHDRLHTIIRPISGGMFGAHAFYVEYRKDGESGPVVRQRVWTLTVDPQLAALRLSAFTPKDSKPLEGAWRDPARLTEMKPADFVPVTGCDVIWRRRADGFSGETRPGACKVITTGADQRVLTVSERHDLSPTTWDVRDIGVDDRGARVFGSAEHAPTRLRRAASFVCWAGSRRGNETVTIMDLAVHDQGGEATANFVGATPNTVTIRLRNVEWPIGQNRPSLTLYIMTGTETQAKAYAWSEPDADRIALDVNGTQASCTRDENAMWR